MALGPQGKKKLLGSAPRSQPPPFVVKMLILEPTGKIKNTNDTLQVLILKISYVHGHDLYYATEFLINNYKRLYATSSVARVDVFVDWLLLN